MIRLMIATTLLAGCIDFDRLKAPVADAGVDLTIRDGALETDMAPSCVTPSATGTWRFVTLSSQHRAIYDVVVDGERAYATVSDPALVTVDLEDHDLGTRHIADDAEELTGQPVAHLAVVGPNKLALAGDAPGGGLAYTLRELLIGTNARGEPVDQFIPMEGAMHTEGNAVQNIGVFGGVAYIGLSHAVINGTSQAYGVVAAHTLPLPPMDMPTLHSLSGANPYAVFGTSFGVLVGEAGRVEFTDGTSWPPVVAPDTQKIDVARAISAGEAGGLKRTWIASSTFNVCTIAGDPNDWTASAYVCGSPTTWKGSSSTVATSPCAPSFGVLAGTSGQLFVSTDDGMTFTLDSPTAANILKVVITQKGRIVAVTDDGQLFVRP